MNVIKKYFPQIDDNQIMKLSLFEKLIKDWNKKINLVGWMLFIISAVGFLISSIGNFWAMFGSLFFLIACLVFLIPFFRKDNKD